MIELKCGQRTQEWHRARLGVVTASNIDRIITPTGRKSSQRGAYMNTLLAEWAIGEPMDDFGGTWAVERGMELEDEAHAYYELQTGLSGRATGFIYRDKTRTTGCSPDWLVEGQEGLQGGVEVKCPAGPTHIGYLLDGEVAKYIPQIQFQLWVTQLPWWDFLSYFPGLPPVLKRHEPDKVFQKMFDEMLPPFLEEMIEARERLQTLGISSGLPEEDLAA